MYNTKKFLIPHNLTTINLQRNYVLKTCALAGEEKQLSAQHAEMVAGNTLYMDKKAGEEDKALFLELVPMAVDSHEQVGVVLISNKHTCSLCGGKLLLCTDRPSHLTLYTEAYGTLPAVHYRQYCSNSRKGCPLVQHYGYHISGLSVDLHYD